MIVCHKITQTHSDVAMIESYFHFGGNRLDLDRLQD